MQAQIEHATQTYRSVLAGLVSALRMDDARGNQSQSNALVLPALLAAYVAAMLIFAVFVRNWAPMHADTAEMAAWGQQFQLGYSKHPPLGAWLAGAWFTLMPQTEWSFNLLATLVAASGLVGVWKLAGLYLDERGRRLSMLPLLLTPAFTTWVFKYNANSILLGIWPWAAYYFLRTMETRSLAAAVMAGVFAGLSMLGKYYSIVLLATLFCVLVLHPQRNRVLASPAPYVAMLAGFIVLAPHLWWLVGHKGTALSHAMSRTGFDPENARITTVRSVVAGLLTLLAPTGLMIWAYSPGVSRIAVRLRAGIVAPDKRWLIALGWGPLVFTILAYVLAGVRIGGDFLLPAFFAVPFVALMQIGAPFEARVVRRVTGAVLIALAAATGLAPIIGIATYLTARHPLLEPRAELAAAATDFWRGATNTPLRRVAGQERAATGIAFYSEDRPIYMDGAAGFHFDRNAPAVRRDGLLFVCGADDAACPRHARAVLGADGYQRFTFTGSHQVFPGYSGPMYTFELFLLPPAQ